MVNRERNSSGNLAKLLEVGINLVGVSAVEETKSVESRDQSSSTVP
jgi:hypothetical protein